MSRREQIIDRVARMMALAYWRGRLEPHFDDPRLLEQMVRTAMDYSAESDLERWRDLAAVACEESLLKGPSQ